MNKFKIVTGMIGLTTIASSIAHLFKIKRKNNYNIKIGLPKDFNINQISSDVFRDFISSLKTSHKYSNKLIFMDYEIQRFFTHGWEYDYKASHALMEKIIREWLTNENTKFLFLAYLNALIEPCELSDDTLEKFYMCAIGIIPKEISDRLLSV